MVSYLYLPTAIVPTTMPMIDASLALCTDQYRLVSMATGVEDGTLVKEDEDEDAEDAEDGEDGEDVLLTASVVTSVAVRRKGS